jgi:hypothetical protein
VIEKDTLRSLASSMFSENIFGGTHQYPMCLYLSKWNLPFLLSNGEDLDPLRACDISFVHFIAFTYRLLME